LPKTLNDLKINIEREIRGISKFQGKSVHNIDDTTATMTRDRFKLLYNKITFDDTNTRNERKNDKMGKIKDFFDALQKILNL